VARPFAPSLVETAPQEYALTVFVPNARSLLMKKAESMVGPYLPVTSYPLNPGKNKVEFKLNSVSGFTQLEW
jgi:hypothetical protein